MSLSVVLAGGGTAGHIEPALAVADALRRLDPETKVTALGTSRGLEVRLVPARGYELSLIEPVPIPRRISAEVLGVPGRVRRSARDASRALATAGADVVAGFGGYVAGPAYLAARRRRIPIVVHEANARPGLANRLGARFAAAVATATPDCRLPGARYVGMPLRRSIAALDRPALRHEAREAFGLDPERPTLLVFGGSQGARRINETVAAAAPDLTAAGIQVLHASGAGHVVDVPEPAPGQPPYVVVPYLDRMDLAYAAADVAVCRGGAMTVAEAAAVGLPAVYVPLPVGNGEQRLNAAPVVAAGGGLLVEDAEFTPEWLRASVVPLLIDPARIRAMGVAASTLGRRDADEVVARMVRAVAGLPPAETRA